MPNENYLFGCPSDIYRCGGIAPVKATEDMTQPVGQKNGKLFTAPGNIVTPGNVGNVMTSTGSGWTSAAPAKELPEVSEANNGQFLVVVNGAWTPKTVPDADGEDF